MLPAVLLLSACAPASDEACRVGFTRAGDGHCYPPPNPEPPSATDAIQALPCEALEPDGLVDLAGGCVEGACVGDPFTVVDAALGEGVDCESVSAEAVSCTWPDHVTARFPALDHDLADPDGAAEWLQLEPGYPHATEHGLGVGVSPSCWVEVLGVPTAAVWVDAAGTLVLRDLSWDPYGVEIHDSDGPDGLSDHAFLLGPP